MAGVERELLELPGEIGRAGGGDEAGDQEQEGKTTDHIVSVAGTVYQRTGGGGGALCPTYD